jgi:hypothetical protein
VNLKSEKNWFQFQAFAFKFNLYRYNLPAAYHGSVGGEGHPAEWPQGWVNPITLTPIKLDPNDAPYKITGAVGGCTSSRIQSTHGLKAPGDPTLEPIK